MAKNIPLMAISVSNACKDAINLRQLELTKVLKDSAIDGYFAMQMGLNFQYDPDIIFLSALRDAALKRNPTETVYIRPSTHKRLKVHLNHFAGVPT